jgi:RimJ/RimL family protein N-acetyltransferase
MPFASATIHDAPLIQAMARAIWPETYAGIISHAQIMFMLDLMYATPVIAAELAQGVTWELITRDAVPVGFLSFHDDGPDAVKLAKLYLLPAARGAGLARAAVERVRDASRRRGRHRVFLTVNKRNLRAIAAYRAIGLIVTADLVTDLGHGYVMDDHRMELPA